MTSITRTGCRIFMSWIVAATLWAGWICAPAHAMSVFSPLGPAYSTSDSPRSIAFSPSGAFVAAASYTGPIMRFSLTRGGALEALPPSDACSGSVVAFKPVGSVLAVSYHMADTVAICSISRTDGSLTPLGTSLPTGDYPHELRFSPDGRFMVAVNDYNVSMFLVGSAGLKNAVTLSDCYVSV